MKNTNKMTKAFMMFLLAALTVSCGLASANASEANDASTASTSGVTKDIATLCATLDKAAESLKNEPTDISRLGESIESNIKDLDLKQKLTPADKALLKKTMRNFMVVVVSSQMEQNPQMAQMFSSLSADQKKEVIDMAMNMAAKEIDSKIDACETLEDFSNISI